MDSFKKLLPRGRVAILHSVKNKQQVLEQVVKLFSNCNAVFNKKNILPDILAREEIFSTGIGAGIAIPHIHKEYIKGINVAFCILKEGIDFSTMDQKPVFFVLMILTSGNEHEKYLKVIAKFANMLRKNDVRMNLLKCENVSEILTILNQVEDSL